MVHRFLHAASLVMLLAVMSPAAESTTTESPPTDPPTTADIAKAVAQLGDDDFRVREAATALLWKTGHAALPALEAAANSNDAERAQRAKSILAKIRLGILPGTPPEILKLIHQFRAGSSSVRRRVIQKLRQSGHLDTAFALIRSETDTKKRTYLLSAIGSDLNKLVEQMLIKRDYQGAGQILEMSAVTDSGAKNLAVFLTLQGKAEAKIKQLPTAAKFSSDRSKSLVLLQLLKLQGDFTAARQQIEKHPHSTLRVQQYQLSNLDFALRDWSALSEYRAKDASRPGVKLSMNQLSIDTTYHRLSGSTDRFNKAVDALKSRATSKPSDIWYCVEALLLNGRQADAIELLKKHDPRKAFELLAARGDYQQAFEIAGVELPLGDQELEFDLPHKAGASADVNQKQLHYFQSKLARSLSAVGEKQRSLKLFNKMAKTPLAQQPARRLILAKDMLQTGFEQEAFALAAALIRLKPLPGASDNVAPYPASRAMRYLFEKRSTTATACWDYFRRMHPDEKPIETLHRIRKIIAPKRAEFAEDTQFKQFRAEVDQALSAPNSKLDAATKNSVLRALGELCAMRGLTAPALGYYVRLAEATKLGQDQLKVADLYAAAKQWKDAAHWYKKAFDAKYQVTLTMFMQGWALTKSGDSKQGDALMKLARLLPLADSRRRYELYKGLDDRKLRDLAQQERLIVVRLGSLNDWHANHAAKELGNDLTKTNPLEAANLWQQSVLSVLQTNSAFMDATAYLRLPYTIHKVRSRGLLEAGKHDAAVRELWLAHQALPADIDLALDMVPLLRKAKLDPAADQLFEKVYAVNQRITETFPNSAHHHNSTAWLAARCNRRLDAALTHAQTAVRLAPDKAAYLDTLAEVHHARGNKQKATELSRRCIEMEPQSKIYPEQLKRFQQ